METKYILVEWPDSQHFIGHPDCHLCVELDSAWFVPETLYNKIANNENNI